MLHDIAVIMRGHPEIVIFLALALGYFFGKRIKIFGFSLGTTASVLLAALVVGQVGIEVPEIIKNISFALFIFCVGYKVGPQFFNALKGDGYKYILIVLVVAFTAAGSAIALGKLLGSGQGTTAGIFAGAMTTSAALGTAGGAISQLSVSTLVKGAMNVNVAVAYAITYIFGTAGAIIILKLIPALLKVDLKAEAKKLEKEMGIASENTAGESEFSWASQLDLRAYKISNKNIPGKKVQDIEALLPGRVAIEKIKRAGNILEAAPDIAIQQDDILLLVGRPSLIVRASEIIGPETDPSDFGNVMGETMEVCVLNRNIAGKTLGELSKDKLAHGVFLKHITRQSHEIPVGRDIVVHKCDVLQFIGGKDDVERVVKLLGYAERPTIMTDLTTLVVGCIAGTLLGLIVIPAWGLPITLGVEGGVLVAGLLCGWLRSIHPTFGQIPGPAQWLLSDFGLNFFIACVGITAGPHAVHAFKTSGMTIFLSGIVVTTLPLLAGFIFGRKVFKMNILLLLGSLSGAHNVTAALNELTEEAESAVPAIAYAVPYAVANVVLTVMGSFIINIMR
ncbi:MAG: aspartate-alanine antiporter [Candidatus Omnitrophota bacterium]|jgi:putative transport protein